MPSKTWSRFRIRTFTDNSSKMYTLKTSHRSGIPSQSNFLCIPQNVRFQAIYVLIFHLLSIIHRNRHSVVKHRLEEIGYILWVKSWWLALLRTSRNKHHARHHIAAKCGTVSSSRSCHIGIHLSWLWLYIRDFTWNWRKVDLRISTSLWVAQLPR